MSLAPRLDMRQSQQLVMTPQLQQAIKLLQYSNVELTDFVMDEVEKNPLLEVGEVEIIERGSERQQDGEVEKPKNEDGLTAADHGLEGGGVSNDSPLDADMGENVFNSDNVNESVEARTGNDDQLSYNGGGAVSGAGTFSGDMNFEGSIQEHPDLRAYLTEQIKITPFSQQDMLVASYIIEMVDDAGYMQSSLEDLSESLGLSNEDIDKVLSTLQGMDPVGVFARDLEECLKLQLIEKDRFDPCMQALLANLNLLANRELSKLKKICGVDAEDLADMVREIQELNPKPGLAYSSGEPIQPVVPDAYVKKSSTGSWLVELNTGTLPKVLVNGKYYSELAGVSGDKSSKTFVSECYANANWLVKALDQRARTILKVATELVKQQEEFFTKGVRYLKPLNLKTVAEAIEMHESTVSRVTANKYLGTSRGIFEMKYFFTSSISSSDGNDSHSAHCVRDHIKGLIDAEDPKSILSDDKLVDLLKHNDIDIARRTVAKYREALHIPSSVQRRRQKNIAM
jgi:RNA polymerase sigma-54 factor